MPLRENTGLRMFTFGAERVALLLSWIRLAEFRLRGALGGSATGTLKRHLRLSGNTRKSSGTGGGASTTSRPAISADLRRQFREARRRAQVERRAGRHAAAAAYDARTGRITVELTNGDTYAFLAKRLPTLAHATPAQIAQVEVSPGGFALDWECLDTGVSVPGLLLSSIGRRHQASELARVAGQVRSAKKAAAARANGAKGGRPRKSSRRG